MKLYVGCLVRACENRMRGESGGCPGRASNADRHAIAVADAREPVLYVDAQQLCVDHNRALEHALGRTSVRIDGRPLREVLLGCRIGIDGYGRGSGCFDTLASMPFDFLKIDGYVINRMTQDAVSLAKVKGLTRLAHASGARVVAGRVQNEHTLKKLCCLGVDFAQGFAVSMPVSIDAFCAETTQDLHEQAA